MHEGDVVTVSVDDEEGRVILGEAELVPPASTTLEGLRTVTGWADEIRRMRVRANADPRPTRRPPGNWGPRASGYAGPSTCFSPSAGSGDARSDPRP